MADVNEQWAAALAAMDQFKSATKEIGAVIAEYFKSLVDQGLSREEALLLTAGFQGSILALMFQQPAEEPGQ